VKLSQGHIIEGLIKAGEATSKMTRSTGGTQFFTIWVSLQGYLGAKWCLATLRASDLRESVEAIFLYDLSPEATYYLFLPYSVGHTDQPLYHPATVWKGNTQGYN